MEKYKEPQVYVINNSEIAEKLQEKYIVEEGNLGITKQIEYEQYENHKYVNLEYDLIGNLHEYKVVIIDLQNKSVGKICMENDLTDGMPYLFQIDYPMKQFDPAPFVMNQIRQGMNHEWIRIVFSDKDYTEHYKIVQIEKQNQVGYPEEFETSIARNCSEYISRIKGISLDKQ